MKSIHFLPPTAAIILSASLFGQITIVDSGANGNQANLAGAYTQNFDSLPTSTPMGGASWNDNITIPGWYTTQISISANDLGPGIKSFGTDSDRALGAVNAYWGLRLINSSSQTITGLQVSYTGEQWFRGANDPQAQDQMFFLYRVYGSAVSANTEVNGFIGIANWIREDAFGFLSPNFSSTTASDLDGNAPENQVNVSFFLPVTLAPGEKLWLKWISSDRSAFADSALAIDNLSVSFSTAIPESSSFATLAGTLGITMAASRRQRRVG